MSVWVVLGVVVALLAAVFGPTLHQVPEGFVAVYWRGGALTDKVAAPGYHLKVPIVTSLGLVQTSLQTDVVKNIPCGTHGGTIIEFGRIEVVNRLPRERVLETIRSYGIDYDKVWIHDKIHHEINQFCSRHSIQEVLIEKFSMIDEVLQATLQEVCNQYDTGIEIFNVRVTKPNIPLSISRNYEAMEVEKTRLLIATEAARVSQLEAETERQKELIRAEQESEVSKILQGQLLAEKQTDQEIAIIEDTIRLERAKSLADAELYKAQRLAAADQLMLTDAFLALKAIHATANTTVVYGDEIPDIMGGRSTPIG